MNEDRHPRFAEMTEKMVLEWLEESSGWPTGATMSLLKMNIRDALESAYRSGLKAAAENTAE